MTVEETVITLTVVHERGEGQKVLDAVEDFPCRCETATMFEVESKTRELFGASTWRPTRKVKS